MGLVYGVNSVKEAILSGKTINKIFTTGKGKEIFEILNLAKENQIITVKADKIKLDKMITKENEKLKNSQGVVASVTDYNYFEVEDIINYAKEKNEPPFIVILDKIEDPHNLGAIIRSAECIGAHGIIIPKRNACLVTDVVEKAAEGATNYLRVARVTNITTTIQNLKKQGVWVYGLDMDGACAVYDTNLTGAIAIVIGNEGEGISRLVKENCDGIIKIPMKGKTESLNASVSAAICMYEISRQNINKGK